MPERVVSAWANFKKLFTSTFRADFCEPVCTISCIVVLTGSIRMRLIKFCGLTSFLSLVLYTGLTVHLLSLEDLPFDRPRCLLIGFYSKYAGDFLNDHEKF